MSSATMLWADFDFRYLVRNPSEQRRTESGSVASRRDGGKPAIPGDDGDGRIGDGLAVPAGAFAEP